jgi:formylglycine-generating enzyme required for sulfatase activity
MICPNGCGEMMAGEILWVCGWCGASLQRAEPSIEMPPPFVKVPAGAFFMGCPKEDSLGLDHEKPLRKFYLSGYKIGLLPVTNGLYYEFVKNTGKQAPDHWTKKPPLGANSKHPVTFVSWQDAKAFCGWLSTVIQKHCTLPTEAQWEKAARGGEWLDGDLSAKIENPLPQRKFPHGNEIFKPNYGNFGGLEGGTTVVGIYPEGAGPYGCLDLAGNVSEWCLDTFAPKSLNTMPYRDPVHLGKGKKVLKGGSWRSEPAHLRCSNRYFYERTDKSYGIGFRVAITD